MKTQAPRPHTPQHEIDYDQEADVLYISIERHQKATNSQLRDDGVLLRYHGKKLVGITVFDASKR